MTNSLLNDVTNKLHKREINTRAPHAEANARLLSLNALKGHTFVKKPYRVMPICQIVAHVMVNVH